MKVVFDINMDAEEFRKFGYAAIDFVADYLENIRERLVYIEPKKVYATVVKVKWNFIHEIIQNNE